ncbi:MAG: hypothetical protein AB7G05_08745 [Hyphomonadaceae bacterium]
MRAIMSGALLLLAAACSQDSQNAAPQAAACALEAQRTIAWTGAEAADVVAARAEGPSCTQAIVTWSVRRASGDPLWAFSATYHDMVSGGAGAEGLPPASAEEVQRFLDAWAEVSVNSSADLPAWPEAAATLGEAVEGVAYYTDLDRDAYEDLRQRNLPQLCFAASAESARCLVIDPYSGAPLAIVAYGA